MVLSLEVINVYSLSNCLAIAVARLLVLEISDKEIPLLLGGCLLLDANLSQGAS